MGSFCTSDPTTTQTNSPNPMAMDSYRGILSRAQQIASQPYEAYQGQLTAGLDPTQQAGIANVNSAYGMAQPYFQQAAQYAQQGAAPVANVSGADIQRYYNPYQQEVINSTMANINESDQRQQQQVKGNAAAAGALGGDRQAVAQAELARQQGLARNQTLAGLQNQGYTQAQTMAQSQQQNQQANAQRAANAAYAYGQIGTGAQGAQLQGAGAQLGAGAVAQQNQQAALNAQYGQFQQQQAFPYQQLGWLAGVTAPIAGSMGGTQTTTPPSPNPFSQILGLGTAALGAVAKTARGGRIGYANGGSPFGGGAGGSPYGNIDYERGYIPQLQISAAHPMQFTSVPYKSQPQSTSPSSSSLSSAISGAKNIYGMMSPKEVGAAGTEGFSGTAGGEAAPLGLTGSYEGANATPGFMSGISDMFSGTAPAAGESLAGAGEGLSAFGAGAGESLGGLGAGAGEAIGGLGAGAGEAMAGLGAGAGEALSTAGPVIAETAAEWGPVIAETAAEWGPVVGEALAEYGPMLLAFLKDGGRINGRYADGGEVPNLARRYGRTKLREEMGGEPAFFGPLQRALFGDKFPLHGRSATDVASSRRQQMRESEDISEAVPRHGYADGGFVDMVHSIRGAIRGGRRYADGGDIETIDYDGGDWAPQEVAPQAMADWRQGADLTARDPGAINAPALPPVSPAVAMPQQGLPPEITAGMSRPGPQMPPSAMAYDQQAPMAPPIRGDQQPPKEGILGFLDSLRPTMTPEQKAGLMSFGLATAAGTSPFGMSNIGAGGLEGMKAMAGVRKEELAKATSQRSADAEARKLMHDLRRDSVAEQQFKHRQNLDERRFEELKAQHRMPKVMTDENGLPILVDPLSGKIVGRPNSPSETTQPPSGAPALPGAPGASSAPPKSEEEQGIIPANARLVQGGAYNYKDDAPYIEKGMDVPDPQGVAGRSPRSLQTDAEYYLQTGKLPTVRGGKSPVAIQDTQYKRAVQNYAGALAQSRGLSPDQTAEMWRTAPGMLRFILGADGRATVSLGTAVRHLDTLKQLADAWKEGSTIGNWQTWNRLSSSVRREFGDSAVTNLESASRIVGPEIIKALGVAGAGTEHDRSTAAGQFMTGKGFDQILGAVDTTQKLLGGQLEGKKRQAAQAGVSEERFKGLMGDRAYEVLSNAEKPHAPKGEEPKTGDRKQFKQGWGVWDGKQWVPEKKP